MRLDPRSIHSLDQVVMVKGDLMDVETIAHHVIDGVYMKVFRAPKAGLFIGQHAHMNSTQSSAATLATGSADS